MESSGNEEIPRQSSRTRNAQAGCSVDRFLLPLAVGLGRFRSFTCFHPHNLPPSRLFYGKERLFHNKCCVRTQLYSLIILRAVMAEIRSKCGESQDQAKEVNFITVAEGERRHFIPLRFFFSYSYEYFFVFHSDSTKAT